MPQSQTMWPHFCFCCRCRPTAVAYPYLPTATCTTSRRCSPSATFAAALLLLAPTCRQGSTGYGHGDLGREALDNVVAAIMGAEAGEYTEAGMRGGMGDRGRVWVRGTALWARGPVWARGTTMDAPG